jgi:hypothetical protein
MPARPGNWWAIKPSGFSISSFTAFLKYFREGRAAASVPVSGKIPETALLYGFGSSNGYQLFLV